MRKAKLNYVIAAVLFCISLVFHLTLSAGCASAPPDRVALRSLQVTAKTVDTAMSVAGDLYKNGQITADQRDEILKGYSRYQSLMTVAVLSLDAVKNQADIPRFTEKVNQAAKELLDLISSFQNKNTLHIPQFFSPSPLMA